MSWGRSICTRHTEIWLCVRCMALLIRALCGQQIEMHCAAGTTTLDSWRSVRRRRTLNLQLCHSSYNWHCYQCRVIELYWKMELLMLYGTRISNVFFLPVWSCKKIPLQQNQSNSKTIKWICNRRRPGKHSLSFCLCTYESIFAMHN